ncbi:NfeD family protein [Petralouisia muris]|uniref:NfeD family protein n=1 Tax=Petralouisia muris TaxID=3032872 RepID=A0AC61RWU1_9FIRM|nr:NfeD family protein [Petralouisia muris]TGY96067.1 NfeD family protein [Petralouisia muris]
MDGIFWLIVVVVMAVIEIITLGLTTIWFAGGALLAFAASLLGANLLVQSILFVVTSVVLLAVTRPLAVEFFNKDRTKTNAESLIGKTALVQQEIDNLKAAGMVAVDGQEWSARSADDRVIPAETLVEILEISGVKLLVRQKEV